MGDGAEIKKIERFAAVHVLEAELLFIRVDLSSVDRVQKLSEIEKELQKLVENAGKTKATPWAKTAMLAALSV